MQLKSSVQRTIASVTVASVTGAALLFAWTSMASAGIVTLTGGDASGGLTLDPGKVVVAQALNADPGVSVQGVPFNSLGPGVNFSFTDNRGVFGASPPVTFAGSSANDTALLSVMNEGLQFADGLNTLEVQVTGLAANTNYFVDSLLSIYGYGSRSESITYNGTMSNPQVDLVGSSNAVLDVHTVATTDGTGKLVVDYNQVSSPPGLREDGAVLTAFVVTATPEPSSFILCGLGAIGLFIAARRRKV